jgi:hypothetical protein
MTWLQCIGGLFLNFYFLLLSEAINAVYEYVMSSVVEEPPAPSVDSTLHAFGILSFQSAVPLLRRPLSPAETPVEGCGSRNGLPRDSLLTDSVPVRAGGCVLRAGRGASCAAGARAGTGADAWARIGVDAGAGARDTAATDAPPTVGAPPATSEGASSPPSVATSLSRRSSSETATQPSDVLVYESHWVCPF